MAVSVTLYTFSKKINSTAQPSGGTTFDCVLKDQCGVVSPRIALRMDDSPASYNYAYIPLFERYYFVSEWTWEAGLWVASLSVDALASWKAQIGAENYYCLRASWATPGYIVDTLYPTTSNITLTSEVLSSPLKSKYSDGVYIVSTMSNSTSAVGGMSTYVLNQSEFNSLRSFMFGVPDYTSIDPDEMSQNLQKLAFNPGDYILNSKWIPLNNVPTGGSSTIGFGWWDSGVSARLLGDSTGVGVITSIKIPKHPLTKTRGEQMNSTRYAKYTLYAGPFGAISIDAGALVNSTSIGLDLGIDVIDGDGTLQISAQPSGAIIGVSRARCSVDINMGSIVADISGAISSPLSSVGGYAGSVISSLITGGSVADGLINAMSSTQIGTSGSGKSALSYAWRLVGEFADVVEANAFEFGFPLYESVTPNTHGSAFYIMGDDHVSLPCTDVENSTIVSHLKTGFYYE